VIYTAMTGVLNVPNQWIGFYEVLERITDNHDVSPSWESAHEQNVHYWLNCQCIQRDQVPDRPSHSTARRSLVVCLPVLAGQGCPPLVRQ
jgi:hypothetical protein